MMTVAAHRWGLRIALAQVLGLGLAAFAAAQEAPATTRREPAKRSEARRDAGQMKSQDAHFAACLILGSQNEIASAKLAEERSKSPEVKEFAQMMEKDHQQCITNLEKFAGNLVPNRRMAKEPLGETRRDSRTEGSGNGRATSNDEKRTEQEPQKVATEKALAGATGMPTDMHLQIHQEIADECLASTQRELSSKEGREFDACYIGMQIAAHMHMVDEMKVLERHASPDLQAVLQKGLKVAEGHLAQAKEIMKDIDKGETRKTTAK